MATDSTPLWVVTDSPVEARMLIPCCICSIVCELFVCSELARDICNEATHHGKMNTTSPSVYAYLAPARTARPHTTLLRTLVHMVDNDRGFRLISLKTWVYMAEDSTRFKLPLLYLESGRLAAWML